MDQKPKLSKLKELDTRLQKVLRDSVVISEEVRAIEENYSKETPLTKDQIQLIYKERLLVFDCLESGEHLPKVISDKCFLQSLLMLEMMMVSKVSDIHKYYIENEKRYVNMSPRAFRRLQLKNEDKLYNQGNPMVTAVEHIGNVMELLFLRFQVEYPEVYSKYKQTGSQN